jgi:hypothetical protein
MATWRCETHGGEATVDGNRITVRTPPIHVPGPLHPAPCHVSALAWRGERRGLDVVSEGSCRVVRVGGGRGG